MKVYVDKNICIGCGLCTSVASSIFALGGNGVAEPIIDKIPIDLEEAVTEASDSCPVGAISIE